MSPSLSQPHQPTQNVPVRQGGVPGKQSLQGRQRPLRVSQSVLRLLPVREKAAHLPFRPLVSPGPDTARVPPRIQQILHRRLLPRGEKGRVGRNAPVLGQLQLVQHPGQQDPLLSVPGTAVQQLPFIHLPVLLSCPSSARRASADSIAESRSALKGLSPSVSSLFMIPTAPFC